jgi:Fe-Mn family superoxide dismutase
MTANRREILGIAGGALVVSKLAVAKDTSPRPAAAPPTAPVKPGAHEVAALPFDPAKLRGLSAAMLTSHHDNNYAAAVKNLNKVELELDKVTKDTPGFMVAGLRERELTYTNSKILHERYFGNLGGDGKVADAAGKRLAAQFGSSARWEELFRATAMALGGGSGWVVLDLNFASGDLRIYGVGAHNQALASGHPLVVLDMFEHAYAIDFGAAHAKYIDAFFQNLRWEEVERRLAVADLAHAELRRYGS